MQYVVKGDSLPVLCVQLEAGEAINCQQGGMSWMDAGIEMSTETGGVGKMFGRMLSGESAFTNRYVAKTAGEICFASSVPGSIKAIELNGGKTVIAQKGAYLASTPGVEMSVHVQQKISGGFFGGEGFIMQKFTGQGVVFLEVDGFAVEYDLGPGQSKTIDTGYLVSMDGTCTMSVEKVKGVANVLFGGEGLFNTVVSGPGHIMVQTMPKSALASVIASMLPSK